MGLGGQNVGKKRPSLFLGRKSCIFWFFLILSQKVFSHSEKVFWGPDSIGLLRSGVGRAVVQCMQFLVVFALLAFLATLEKLKKWVSTGVQTKN